MSHPFIPPVPITLHAECGTRTTAPCDAAYLIIGDVRIWRDGRKEKRVNGAWVPM